MAKLKFWGVRGSLAVGSSTYGSNTSCVEVDLGNGHSVFFDAGTGIRAATLKRDFKKITLCLSHFHWDHIQGLPFVSQLEDPKIEFEIVTGFSDVWERLSVLFDERFHPVPLEQIRKNLKTKSLQTLETYSLTKEIQITAAPLNHPGTSYAFKLFSKDGSFVYATDSDYDPLPEAAGKLLSQADFAVMDSQFLAGDAIQKAHYGHASFKKAIDTLFAVKAKAGFLFHFDPNYSDAELKSLEDQAKSYSEKTFGLNSPKIHMSKEGFEQEISL